MDLVYDSEEPIKKCYKCDEPVLCNLNVIYNTSNTTITLWNKFQIFVYENLEFECICKVIVPEFQIHSCLASSNYLMCVDYSGNVHITSLKFKNAAQKRFKCNFQPRACGIMASALYSEDYTICLKYESDTYFLTMNKINTEFYLEKKVIIICKESLPLQQMKDKYIVKPYLLSENQIEDIKSMFNIEEMNIKKNTSLIIISFDRLSIYSCIFNPRMIEEEVTLVKLYTCPSEISDIEFILLEDLHIIIGLTIGTLICLNTKNLKSPQIIHVNTAIHKFSAFKDSIIFTDGCSMWKADKTLSKNIKFSELFVKNVKDFIKFGDQVICTTFENLIYTFSIDDERCYVKPLSTDEYCSAEKLINSSEYLQNILDEVKKNEVLIKMQSNERNYITALSLSNRQDIMDTIINQTVTVYENYEDAISENGDVVLTNNFSEYFDAESFYFLINVSASSEHRLGDILSNKLGDLRLHIALISEEKAVKTTTVKLTDLVKQIVLLIPLKTKFINTTEMRVDLKIITNMPGALDTKQNIWTILYRKNITLNSENFIKLSVNTQKYTHICLKETKESLENLIMQTAKNQYGNLIEFTDLSNKHGQKEWYTYIRLPTEYQEVFKKEVAKEQLTSRKYNYFLQQFTSDDFLNSKSSLTLPIANEKVKIAIDSDGFSNPSMKITSHNIKILLDIRNFLSNFVYNVFTDTNPGKEFINHSFYITVENLQRSIRECITNSSEKDILPLIESFEKKVIGLLPI